MTKVVHKGDWYVRAGLGSRGQFMPSFWVTYCCRRFLRGKGKVSTRWGQVTCKACLKRNPEVSKR